MGGKDSNIFAYDTCPAICQIHNSLEGGVGWDQIADVRENFTFSPRQVVRDRDCHKHDHHNFDVNDTCHQPARNLANKQADQVRRGFLIQNLSFQTFFN